MTTLSHADAMPTIPLRRSGDPALGPAAPWLAAALLLTGIGTVVLGPLLPHLSAQLHLSDSVAGRLLAAKFVGAFLGGITTRHIRWGIGFGALLSAAGFAWLGMTGSVLAAAAALAISGYGVGQMITAINILAGRRYTQHTGSALTLLNLFWSVGATICGAVIALLLPRLGLRTLMLVYAAAFVLVFIGGEVFRTGSAAGAEPPVASPAATTARSLRPWIFAAFALVLFLYGGLETCLSDWITTYAQRYGGARQLLDGQSAVILLWTAITIGRGIAAGVLQGVTERTVALWSMGLTAVFAAGLLLTHSGTQISAVTLLLGGALAAYFPTMFAALMRWQPRPQQAGTVLAVSGLGAAGFLWLTGAISTHFHSLRLGMAVPLTLACLLLVVTYSIPLPAADTSRS